MKETKTLKIIQVLNKIGKILSIVVYVCCIVGVCGCLVGIASLALGIAGIKISGKTLEVILIENGTSKNELYAIMLAAIFLCVGEGIIAKFAQRYFEHELRDGTPFTFKGADELFRLGITEICVSLGTIILAAITVAVFESTGTPVKYDFGNYSAVSTGIACLLVSLVYKHGAEVAQIAASNSQDGESADKESASK